MDNQHRSHEETARKRNQALGNFMYFLSWVALCVSGLIALIGFNTITRMLQTGFDILPIIIFVIFGGLTYLIWRNKDNLRVEYDYTFTPVSSGQADLDVAKVFGNSRRKLMTSLSLKTVESAGAVTHPSFHRYLQANDVKKHNWFVNREAHLYYFYFVKANVKHAVVLELSEEMVSRVKPFLGFGVWQG